MALRWALIGASDIAATRMIPAMRAVGDEVAIVQSGSADRAQEFASTHEIAGHTTGVDEAVSADVDAVYISSTNDRHAAQAAAAVAAGRHVLCEKPLALTAKDAVEVVRAAAAAGTVFATNHHLRHAPVHRLLRRLVTSGELGPVVGAGVSRRAAAGAAAGRAHQRGRPGRRGDHGHHRARQRHRPLRDRP